MKRKNSLFLFISIALMCFVQMANAKTWRVNNASDYNGTSLYGSNLGGSVAFPVFKEVNQAVAYGTVNDNDTLHVEGATLNYANAQITKRLVIIGPGYFLAENPNSSFLPMEAKIGTVIFAAGSAGSQIMGMHIYNNYNGSSITILYQANDVVIKRCQLDDFVYLDDNLTNVYVLQNFFYNPNPAVVVSAVVPAGNIFPSNFVFNHNICQRTLLLMVNSNVMTVLECRNNVFDCPLVSGGTEPSILMNVNSFQNNILKTAGATVSVSPPQSLSYNISTSVQQFGNSNNNVVIPDMTTLFVDPATNSTDGDYQLKTGLPANYLDANNTDRGAFGGLGGTSRYVLSGLGAIPVTYQINTSGVSDATGLPVIIKARTIQ